VRQEVIVVPLLSIHTMGEDWHHGLIRVVIEVVYLVALVDYVGHHIGRWGVDDSGGDDIQHIPVVFVFGNVQLLVTEELPYSRKMDVASKDCDTNRLLSSNVLQLPDEPVSFLFVVLCGPVVVPKTRG
jgi:hypothetical protein